MKTSLPIHLCGISGILAGIMMLRPSYIGFEFLALIGSAGVACYINSPVESWINTVPYFQILCKPFWNYPRPIIFSDSTWLSG